jgi:predicted transcriptional regulator
LSDAAVTTKPEPGEPKVCFTSVNALAQVLSNENIELLRLMAEQKTETISELAELSGRQKVTYQLLLRY